MTGSEYGILSVTEDLLTLGIDESTDRILELSSSGTTPSVSSVLIDEFYKKVILISTRAIKHSISAVKTQTNAR